MVLKSTVSLRRKTTNCALKFDNQFGDEIKPRQDLHLKFFNSKQLIEESEDCITHLLKMIYPVDLMKVERSNFDQYIQT